MKNIDFTDFFNVFLSGATITGLFTLHLKQIFIIRKYFTALLTVNRAFYLPFYEKRQKSSCIFGGYVV